MHSNPVRGDMMGNGDENVRCTEDEAQSPSFNEYQNELGGVENYHNMAPGQQFTKAYEAEKQQYFAAMGSKESMQQFDQMSPSTTGRYPTTQMTTEYNEFDYFGGPGDDERYRGTTLYSQDAGQSDST